MRRKASNILRDLEMRVTRLEDASKFRYASKGNKEEVIAKSIAKAVASLFEKSYGSPAFLAPQVETTSTNLIEVSQKMLFRLTEAQFGSRLHETGAYYQSFNRLPRSRSFKKTLAAAIEKEAHDKRIHINSLAQKTLRVSHRELAKKHSLTGEVSFYIDHLEVQDMSLRQGNFSIAILYKQYFKPEEARI